MDDLTGMPLDGDVELSYISPREATTETLFGATAFEVCPGGDTTTGAVVIVLDDGSVCTLAEPTSPFRSGPVTLSDLKEALADGQNHTVRITDNGVSAAAEKIAAALAETLSAVGPGGSKEVSKFFGIDSDSGNPIMVCPGSPTTHHGYQSLVDKVNEAAASIHEENGGPPVTVTVAQHGGSTEEPTRGTAYTVFTFHVASRARWCAYEQFKPGYVVVSENLATGLEELMKRVRGWIASTMCEAVGAWPLPLMTKFEQKPDLRRIIWSRPGDTVTFLGSAGEKTFTVSGRAMVRGVAVPGLDDHGLDDPSIGGPGIGGPGIGGQGFDDPGLDDPSIGGPGFNGPDPDEQLDRAEERLAIASLALDAATKEGQEDLAPLIAEVEKAKEEKGAAYQRAREAASIIYSPETMVAGIEEHRATKKRPADDDDNDDDGAVAPMLKEGQGEAKRQRTRDFTIVNDCGVVDDRTSPRSKTDEVIDSIRTTTIPGIEASIALLERLLATTPNDNPVGSGTVDGFYTINGNSLEDMIALRREELSEFNRIIAGLENRKREIETIERKERELRRRYEELCRRGGEEA